MADDEDYDESGSLESDQETCYAELLATFSEEFSKPGWLGPKLTNLLGPENDLHAHVSRGMPTVCMGTGQTVQCKILNENNMVAHFSSTPAEIMLKAKEYVIPLTVAWKRLQKPGYRFTQIMKSWDIEVQGRLKREFLACLLACCCAVAGRPNEPKHWHVLTEPEQRLKEHSDRQQAAAAAAKQEAAAQAAAAAAAAAAGGGGGAPAGGPTGSGSGT